jgi:hypothetical protein
MRRLALVVGIVLLPHPAWARDDRAHLVGTWVFQSEVDTTADGKPAPGSSSTGYDGQLIYTADGHMSVVIMPKGRNWAPDTAALEELRATAGDGTAYAGRYEVDPASHTVTHVPIVSLQPEHQRKRLSRRYELSGDTLVLSGSYDFQGQTMQFRLTWARAR